MGEECSYPATLWVQCLTDGCHQSGHGKWFWQGRVRPEYAGQLQIETVERPGDRHDGERGLRLAQSANQLQALHFRHDEVGNDQVDVMFAENPHRSEEHTS